MTWVAKLSEWPMIPLMTANEGGHFSWYPWTRTRAISECKSSLFHKHEPTPDLTSQLLCTSLSAQEHAAFPREFSFHVLCQTTAVQENWMEGATPSAGSPWFMLTPVITLTSDRKIANLSAGSSAEQSCFPTVYKYWLHICDCMQARSVFSASC